MYLVYYVLVSSNSHIQNFSALMQTLQLGASSTIDLINSYYIKGIFWFQKSVLKVGFFLDST